jgi:hypothetical protein
MGLAANERIALEWVCIQQGERPSFRLRYDRCEAQTGMSRLDAGMAIDGLRRAGFVNIETIVEPYRKHVARITDKGIALARTILPASNIPSAFLPAEQRCHRAAEST